MTFNTSDPNDRKRLDAESFMAREQEIWRLHVQNYTVRAIARELGCPRTSVHRTIMQRRKLADAMATGEPGNVVAVITDELICDDVQSPDDVPKLNTLELYRLAFVPDLPADVRAARATAWAAISRQPDTGRVYSDGGQSWRAGVDRAMAGDSGTDADNEW